MCSRPYFTLSHPAGADTTLLASLGSVSPDNWYEVDLTSIITADGTYSLRVSDSVGGADYSSKEGANAPKLLVSVGGASPQSCAGAGTATPTPGPSSTPTNTPTPGPSPTPTTPPSSTPTSSPPEPFNNATFVYDGDGKRVKSIFNGTTTTYFVGTHYEVTGSTITKYYGVYGADGATGAQRIAMRTNGTVNYLLGDHLGSTSLTTDANGQVVAELRYRAWGETRYASGTTPTDYQYTGQYSYAGDFGLHFYNARWYDPALGRFAQADSIVPGPSNSQAWDRYSYSFNNPLLYSDPTGHNPVPGFFEGLIKEFARTIAWFHPGYQKDLAIQANESEAELAGRLVADVVSIGLGLAGAGAGTGSAGGGLVACVTVAGCPLVGAEAIAVGGVLIAQGSGMVLTAADGLGTTLAAFSAKGSAEQGDPGGTRIERHHPLPQQFRDKFENAGLDIEDYTVDLPRDFHKDIHGRGGGEKWYNSWNRQWNRFFERNPNPNRDLILEQLRRMKRDFDIP